ncbi:MAG: F0F1 ATP synthase subunit delta [Propionibacteriales bacterium]|nr:F0F1 ATP synthase subunit delta [Propionibacteriales bacterium]
MRGISAESLDAVLATVEEALAAGGELTRIGDDLFFAVSVLDGNPQLRRALTDPAAGPELKEALARRLFEQRLQAESLRSVLAAVVRRWSQPRDIADALERAGIEAHVANAERGGELDDVEDELFRLGRVVAADKALRDAVTARLAPLRAKRELIARLVEGKVTTTTLHLAQQATAGRHRSFGVALAEYGKTAAARQQRLVATVRVASPLDEQSKQRLADALNRHYGRPVHLNFIVDPQVVGGARVEIGDEVIDGTVATRVEDARRRVAG